MAILELSPIIWIGQMRIPFENATLRSCRDTWSYVLSPAKLKGHGGTMQQNAHFVAPVGRVVTFALLQLTQLCGRDR